MRLARWLRRIGLVRPGSLAAPPADLPVKWLPVIGLDDCTGCGLCVQACGNHCLELVWDFATLARPQDCDSDGGCVDACPEKIIRMAWVPPAGARA